MKTTYSSERGNVLIYIFIAIALFAALSFSVADIMRTGDPQSIGREQSYLYADEILDYTRKIRETVQYLRISNGCSDDQISFENTTVTDYENTNAPNDNSCHVFHPNGGGMTYMVPPDEFLAPSESAKTRYGEWYFLGESCVYNVGTSDGGCHGTGGADDSDLVVVLPWIKLSVCNALNNRADIPTLPQANNQPWNSPMLPFTGTYTQGGHVIQSDNNDTSLLDGRMFGCLEGEAFPQSGTYHFYQVLLPR